MPKLHELLAVESNLRAQAEKTRAELANTFAKKTHLFSEKLTTFQPNQEGAPAVSEQESSMETTVPKELKWISQFIIKSIDASYQVDEGNTIARADIVLENGTVLAEKVPGIALLQLEKRMNELMEFCRTIPTLDPAKGYQEDPSRGQGIYKAREDHRIKTQKVQKALVLYPATEKHPAQVQLISVDEPIGTLNVQEWSGLLTVAQKGRILERVEDVARSVKRARARANDVEVDVQTKKIGQKLLKHIFAEYI